MAERADSSQSTCQTPGAVFRTSIGAHGAIIRVELPDSVTFDERAARDLEIRVHSALELAFAPLFVEALSP